jgi:Bacterial capsule synthesis protein PGA_cap
MSNANNHSFDVGEAGERQTIAALRRAGIAQPGLPGQIEVLAVDGLRVAIEPQERRRIAAAAVERPRPG